MQHTDAVPSNSKKTATRVIWALGICWVFALGASLAFNWVQMNRSLMRLAQSEVVSSFNKDAVYRRWAAMHGGVYVPPTDRTPPNPYLSFIPDRDVTTTGGKHLTLMNPAYMTRQVHELGFEQYGLVGRITSLDPLRPENAPDAWEAEMLLSFGRGEKEALSVETIDGQPYVRYMRPFVTETSCLKCHGHQGYEVGDIRGGISISAPLAAYKLAGAEQQRSLLMAHGIIGGLGLIGLWAGAGALRRSGRRMEQKSAQFQSLFMNSPVSIIVHDPETGAILDANARAWASYGFSSLEELRGNAFWLEPPHAFDNALAWIRKADREGPQQFEWLSGKASGELFWEYVHLGPILINGEKKIMAVSIDVTERKQAEEALIHSRDLLRYIIDHANSAVAVHDRNLRYLYVSQSYLDQYHVKDRDVIGRHHYEVFPDLPQKWRDVHQRVLAGEVLRADRDPYHRADGSVDWTRWECRPWYEADGSIGGLIVYTEVITERVMAEQELLEREAKYRLLAENTADCIWMMDMDLVFTYINPAIEKMMGFEPDEWIGSRLSDHCSQERFEQMSGLVMEALQRLPEATPVLFETEMLNKDGKGVPLEMRSKFVMDQDGKPIALQGVARDISERKKHEAERERLRTQLTQAQKMESIGRLAGGVAHDYNNMLSVISGFAELGMEKTAPGDPLRADLEEILRAARRSANITRQLLAFARRQTISPRVIDLNDTVEGMLKMLRRLIGEDIDLSWQPAPGRHYVRMDPSQLDQILANLLVNARDAIGDVGKVTIETGRVRFDEAYCAEHPGFMPGDFVLLAVSDNGRGMDRQTLDNLFEPFFTTKGVGEGTGLGLSTVYGIVKQNEGFINVYSEPDKGTAFRIYLLRYRGETELDVPFDEEDAPRGRGETVLIVEDEAPILELAARILEEAGYSVLKASGPLRALALAETYKGGIQLLITDVVMPEMNGRDLARKLQALHPDLKVLFMSGYTANVIAHHGVLDAGVHFIQKPFSNRGLMQKVRAAL